MTKPSFPFSAPDIAPRTEWACQPVVVIMSSTLAAFGALPERKFPANREINRENADCHSRDCRTAHSSGSVF